MKKDNDDISTTLRLSREKMDKHITLLFADGSRHVIRPTKAFECRWRDLADAVAEGRSYFIERETRQ